MTSPRFRAAIAAAILLLAASCGIFRRGDDGTTPTVGERIPVLVFESKLEADPELANVEVVLPPPTPNAEWTQPGGNAAKSLGHVTLGGSLGRAWQVSIGQGSNARRRLNAPPVVAAGAVYTIDTRAEVRAFEAATGRQLWSSLIRLEGETDDVAFGGGVSTDGVRVYATSGYGVAVGLDAKTGARLWHVKFNAPLRGSPAVADGVVYLLTQDNQIFALDGATGEQRWDASGTVETAGLLGAATPAVASGTVVVGFSSGELAALRTENGRTVWQDALARTGRSTPLSALADIDASPVIDRGRVFAIGHGGRMVALDLATGQRVWERNLAGTSIPWSAGDFVFAVTIDGEFAALSRADGRVRWVTQLRRWRDEEDQEGPVRWFGPVLASNRLLLTSSLGEIVFVSPADGSIAQTLPLVAPTFLPPVVAGDTLYILTDDGRLTAYR